MNGVQVGTTIRKEFNDHVSKVVFISGIDGYEMCLFDIQPLNFLKKPIKKNDIKKCIDLAIHLLELENKTFEYINNYSIIKVQVKDILYFEKQGRKVNITTIFGEDVFNDSISNTKNKLPQNFIEPHKSFLVNFNKIIKLKKDFLIMIDKKEIPISRRNLSNIRSMLIEEEMRI